MPGSSGSGASAMRIRYSRSRRRFDDLVRGLLARELAEVLLDVLDFERTGVERVLLDQVFQRDSVAYRILLRGGHVPEAITTTKGFAGLPGADRRGARPRKPGGLEQRFELAGGKPGTGVAEPRLHPGLIVFLEVEDQDAAARPQHP